jgi:hypothetical protein
MKRAMTFLEYVVRELLGPPAPGGLWHCPFHDDGTPSFSVRPPKAGYAVKYKCFGCGAWGDEFDLVRHFHPVEGRDYSWRLERVAALRAEYEAAQGGPDPGGDPDSNTRATGAGPSCPACGLPSRGPGREEADDKDLRRKLDAAWAELTSGERMHLAAAHCLARRHEVPTAVLARFAYEAIKWWEEGDRRHFETCDDDECDAAVCRVARGLPPLTPEEARAGREARRDDSHVRAAASYTRRLLKLIAEANKEAGAGNGQDDEDV